MSLINDVKYEVEKLDLTSKNLRKFGLTIGLIFILISISIYFLYNYIFIALLSIVFGSLLLLFGLLNPIKLNRIYRIWMIIAFILGWYVSRIIISFIFIFVLTPMAIVSRIFKKDFLKLNLNKNVSSYWLKKEENKINYKKMF